jgi:hypothetical protein
MRTLESSFADFSRMTTSRLLSNRAAFTAQKKPDAPPPTTISFFLWLIFSSS